MYSVVYSPANIDRTRVAESRLPWINVFLITVRSCKMNTQFF